MATLLDPAKRTRTGLAQQDRLLGGTPIPAGTILEQSWRDYVFAEVWTRPGLDIRSRYWITIAAAVCANETPAMLDGYLTGALKLGEATVPELREAALHLAVYAGWSAGGVLDAATTRVATALGLPQEPPAPLRAEPWDADERLAEGGRNFETITVTPPPPPITPYFQGGILNFVFGEMWMRPGLDQRARRWLTLVGVVHSTTDVPVNSHVYAAMAAKDATMDEMMEFVLQYAIYGGWPRASEAQSAIFRQGGRIAKGLPFEP